MGCCQAWCRLRFGGSYYATEELSISCKLCWVACASLCCRSEPICRREEGKKVQMPHYEFIAQAIPRKQRIMTMSLMQIAMWIVNLMTWIGWINRLHILPIRVLNILITSDLVEISSLVKHLSFHQLTLRPRNRLNHEILFSNSLLPLMKTKSSFWIECFTGKPIANVSKFRYSIIFKRG